MISTTRIKHQLVWRNVLRWQAMSKFTVVAAADSLLKGKSDLTSPQRAEAYDVAEKIVNDSSVVPLVLKFKNMQIATLFKHEKKPDLGLLSSVIRRQFNCKTCESRATVYGRLSNLTGPVFMPPEVLARIKPHVGDEVALYEEMGGRTKSLAVAPITGLTIQRGETVGGFERHKGDFAHWTLRIAEADRTAEEVDEALVTRLERAFHRYLPELLPRLVDRIVGDGSLKEVQAALDSLTLMEGCLHKAVYGDQWLGALRWVRSIVQDLKDLNLNPSKMRESDRWAFYARHLLASNCIQDDANDNAVCPFYHTVNANLVDLLEFALCEADMTELIQDRLNPHNYQRRDTSAQLSEGEIKIAMKELREFRNTIMTVEEAGKLPFAVTLKSAPVDTVSTSTTEPSSSMSGFQKMLDAAAEQTNELNEHESDNKRANQFAARAGHSSESIKISSIDSVDGLLEYLTHHPTSKLEIQKSKNVVYLANTTLSEEKRSVPHFWAFISDATLNTASEPWAEVRVVAPLYKYIPRYANAMFITRNQGGLEGGANPYGNCCFPAFLSAQYTRRCGKAFERLNKMEKISLPAEGEHEAALGFGTSAQNAEGEIYSPLQLRVNGTEITINKLF